MATEVKHGGTWRTLTGVEVKHSGSWRTVKSIEVKHGGTWRTVYTSAPTVSVNSTSVSWSSEFLCYAVKKYDGDGSEYKNASAGSSTATSYMSTWLTSGDASGAYIERTINSGSLYSDGIGGSRVSMATDRTVSVRDTNSGAGAALCNLTVDVYDAPSGGNLLSTGTYSLSASYYNACPFCCFTPDTPVMMGSGIEMPIGRIRPGDEIIVYCPKDRKNKVEKVGEIITRQNRTMHVIQFDDGSILKASDDHPLHVEEKGGPACINPLYPYKDHLDIPEKLLVGDAVTRPDGTFATITYIGPLDYPGTVFTLSNSLFYANGKLVY